MFEVVKRDPFPSGEMFVRLRYTPVYFDTKVEEQTFPSYSMGMDFIHVKMRGYVWHQLHTLVKESIGHISEKDLFKIHTHTIISYWLDQVRGLMLLDLCQAILDAKADLLVITPDHWRWNTIYNDLIHFCEYVVKYKLS